MWERTFILTHYPLSWHVLLFTPFRNRPTIWWARWWNAPRTTSAASSPTKPRSPETGRTAGESPVSPRRAFACQTSAQLHLHAIILCVFSSWTNTRLGPFSHKNKTLDLCSHLLLLHPSGYFALVWTFSVTLKTKSCEASPPLFSAFVSVSLSSFSALGPLGTVCSDAESRRIVRSLWSSCCDLGHRAAR